MKQFTKRFLAILCSLAMVLSGIIIATPQEAKAADPVVPVNLPGFVNVTINDFADEYGVAIADGDYSKNSEFPSELYTFKATNTKNMDKTLFSTRITYSLPESGFAWWSRIYFGGSEEWAGLCIYPEVGGDKITVKDMNNHHGGFVYQLPNTTANVDNFMDAEFLLQISMEYIANDNDGVINDVRLGLYFNGVLYNNEHIILSNCDMSKLGNNIGFYREVEGCNIHVESVELNNIAEKGYEPSEEVDKAAAISVGYLHEKPWNFITANTYPAGSTVTFEAYAPEGITGTSGWWGACAMTNPSDSDVYACTGANMLFNPGKLGRWASYSYKFPETEGDYYFAIGGAPGVNSEWWGGKQLLIDNLKVVGANGEVLAEETFDHAFEDSIFAAQEMGWDYENGVEIKAISQVIRRVMGDKAVALTVDKMHDGAPADFITKEAYPGGSTISFKLNVPAVRKANGEATWWAVSWTTNKNNVGLYNWTDGVSGTSRSTTKGGVWEEFSCTLPDDGQDYYFYIVGAQSEWGQAAILIDDFKVTDKAGNVIATEDFNAGVFAGLFEVNGEAVSEYSFSGVCLHETLSQGESSIGTCVVPGVIGETYCITCGELVSERREVISNVHDTIHFPAVEPGCHSLGNVEYWFCTVCEGFWTDEACTQLTNSKSVNLPAKGSDNVEHVEAKEADCYEEGNVEYWHCPDCEGFWLDEACTRLTNALSVKLPASGHNTIHFDAVTPGCHSNGNVEYWFCEDCEGFWTDAECTRVTNSKSVNLPATGSDNVVHFDAVEPGCHYNGNVEYWYCPDCEGFWLDGLFTQVTNSKSVVLPATEDGEIVHVEAKAATCNAEGNIEYWHCMDCEQFWQNEELTQLTNSHNVIIGKTNDHKAVKLPAVAAQVGKTGLTEGSKCSVCGTILKAQEKTPALALAAPKASKVTKATGGKKQITVKFKKVSGVTRYEIQIATKKNMKKGLKTYKVTKAKDMKNAKYVVKKLKAKTTYYVRIRTVKTVNGVTKTSAWSKAVKASKTK